MIFQEAELLNGNEPIILTDGNMGLFIRLDGDLCGFQVPGEASIRWIHCENIKNAGHGALVEIEAEAVAELSASNLSIGTDYPRQQARLRRLLKEYQSIPE
jgi:hypothetical protein